VVVDVPRATSTIAQALASGFERVLCGAEIEDARDLRARIPDSWSAAREAVRIEGFDVGVSREFLQAEAETPILSTTNGTVVREPRAVARTSRSSAPATRARSRSTTPTARGDRAGARRTAVGRGDRSRARRSSVSRPVRRL